VLFLSPRKYPVEADVLLGTKPVRLCAATGKTVEDYDLLVGVRTLGKVVICLKTDLKLTQKIGRDDQVVSVLILIFT